MLLTKRKLTKTITIQGKLENELQRCISETTRIALFITIFVLIFIFFTTSDLRLDIEVKKTPIIVWYTEMDLRTGARVSWSQNHSVTCNTMKGNISCDITGLSSFEGTPDAYIFYASFVKGLPERNPDTIWAIINEEPPRKTPACLQEDGWRLFNYSATFSRFSDVPMTLLWVKSLELFINKQFYYNTSMKNTFLKDISPVMYLQSDCDSFTERDEYVQELMKYIPIDSYGRCVNNKAFPANSHLFTGDYFVHLYSDELLTFVSKYKFVLAIENDVCEDYVTEKLWRAFSTGVVPIYFGDPNIKDWLLNNNSAILLQDFSTPELLSKHLYKLLKDDREYEEYLEHKIKGKISNERLLKEIEERPYQTSFDSVLHKLYCKVCEGLHEKDETAPAKYYKCPVPISALTQKPIAKIK